MLEKIDIGIIQNTLTTPKTRNGVRKYIDLMSDLHKYDVSRDREFQKAYNGFYRMRQRPQGFYEAYFEYMEKHKSTMSAFEDVLTYLYHSTSRIEASFSSKLLATVNPDMPVWDVNVLSQLSIKRPAPGQINKQKQLRETIETVFKLRKMVCSLFKNAKRKRCHSRF